MKEIHTHNTHAHTHTHTDTYTRIYYLHINVFYLLYLLQGQTRTEWQYVFFIAAAIYGFGALFYAFFASGELQPWARSEQEPEAVAMVTLDRKKEAKSDEHDEIMNNHNV